MPVIAIAACPDRAALTAYLAAYLRFALEDLARCELLFQRHLPGFTSSPESYALAEAALVGVAKLAHAAGVTDPGDIDCLIAVTAGLMDAQVANDPGGDRWTRHLDRSSASSSTTHARDAHPQGAPDANPRPR